MLQTKVCSASEAERGNYEVWVIIQLGWIPTATVEDRDTLQFYGEKAHRLRSAEITWPQ